MITERAGFLSKVFIYPGEDELQSLAEGVMRVLRGEEKPSDYLMEAEKAARLLTIPPEKERDDE